MSDRGDLAHSCGEKETKTLVAEAGSVGIRCPAWPTDHETRISRRVTALAGVREHERRENEQKTPY